MKDPEPKRHPRPLRRRRKRKGHLWHLDQRPEPIAPMTAFAKQQSKFKPDMFQPFDKLQIVTIQQILDGERMNLPLMEEVTKKAQKAKKDDQPTLLSNDSFSLVHEAFPKGT